MKIQFKPLTLALAMIWVKLKSLILFELSNNLIWVGVYLMSLKQVHNDDMTKHKHKFILQKIDKLTVT